MTIHFLNRRDDREPSKHSRVCSCHLGSARKQMVRKFMTATRRNCLRTLPSKGDHRRRKKKENGPKKSSLLEMIDTARKNEPPSTYDADID